jgi:spore germination protein KC
MNNHKAVLKIVAFVLVVLYLGSQGWKSSRDIENRAFVMMAGIDAAPGGNLSLTYNIAIPAALGAGGGGESEGGEQEGILRLKTEAKSIVEARHTMQGKVANPIFFGHLQAIVIGKELAERGVRQVLDVLLRNADIRRKSWFLVTEGNPEEVLEVKPKQEKLPSLYINRALEKESYLQMFPALRFGQFMITESRSDQEPVAIMVKPDKDSITIAGLAIFKGDKMVGQLNATEAHHFLLTARGYGFQPTLVPCPRGEGELVFVTTGAKRSIRPHVEGNKVSFSVLVKVEGNIMEKTSSTSLRDEDYLRAVESSIASKLQRDLRTVLHRLQKELKVDSYGFGQTIRARYPKVWKEIDWRKEFPDVPINIQVEAKIRRLGMAAN